ncbi:MAG: hypothetical protein ACXW1D_00455 [Halobacteriota archaeon]
MNMAEPCRWVRSIYRDSLTHTHSNMQLVQGRTQIEKARQIRDTLGFFTAARYMARRGWSIESARFVLLGV